MTLRKLTNPGVNSGSVDKLYGEDWNRLVDALTGTVAENITLRGNLVRSGTNPLVEILGDDANSFAGVRLRGRDAWDVLAMASAGAPTGGLKFRDTATGATISFDRDGNVGIPAAKRLYLDGDANGVGGDTYVYESSNNVVKVVAGAVESFVVRDDYVQSNLNFLVNSTKKMYLDGGGDSYLWEQSADAVELVAGGGVAAKFQGTIFQGLVKSHTADPTTANIGAGYFAVWKNTTAGETRIWINDGGTMKKSAAFT